MTARRPSGVVIREKSKGLSLTSPGNYTALLGPHSEDVRRKRASTWARILLLLGIMVGAAVVLWAHSLSVNLKQEQEFKAWEEEKPNDPTGQLLKSTKSSKTKEPHWT